MRISTLLFVVVILGTTLVAQNAKQSKDETAIRNADAEWSRAIEAKDLEKATSFYADDASVYPSNAPLVTGRDNIRQTWSHFFDTPGFHLQFAPTKIEVAKSGDMDYDAGTFEGRSSGGGPKSQAGSGPGGSKVLKAPGRHWNQPPRACAVGDL